MATSYPPVYADPRRGVTYSQALLEAAAVAPTGRAMLETFEIYHPDGTPDGAIYLVANPVDFEATKEADATRDAGDTVLFMAAPISAEKPEESDTAEAPEQTVTLSNVSGLASTGLRLARGSLVPWEIEERAYASDEPGGPAVLPALKMLIGTARIRSSDVVFTATYGDPANVNVPGIKFRRIHYPTLSP